VIDSHCHIAGPEYADDLAEVVARARAAGVAGALVILSADDGAELTRAEAVRACWPAARFAIGVHPHAAGRFAGDPEGAARLVDEAITAQPYARAVGEIGLDFHYDFAPRDVQLEVFRRQIRLARRRRLPVVIHTREASDETLRVLEEEQGGDVGGVFHCFTENREVARRALELGFHLSLAGIVTFPRALELQEVARIIPTDRLLVETDSPFLAPTPYRGSRNEPAHVRRVAEVIAELRSTELKVLGEATAQNFERLFAP
jgi:TatD DNase family protein